MKHLRLKDVWADPLELVDTTTIFVPMTEEPESSYTGMVYAIDTREDGYKLYMLMTDNPTNF